MRSTPASAPAQKQSPAQPLLILAALFLLAVMTVVDHAVPLFALDGLTAAMGALVLLVAASIVTYSRRHMRASDASRYFGNMVGLLSATTAFLTTNHVLIFAAGWIASGVFLARLIGHVQGWSSARRSARLAADCFMATDAALVLGLGLLSWRFGTASIAEIVARVSQMPSFSAELAAALLAVAALARCAIPPLSRWLLASMTAPTPVSALMHAGMVNAGGFLLLRFAPLLEAAPFVRLSLVGIGAIGALYGIGVMIVRPDIKRSLAGSTVSQMSFMILTCGLGAYAAALWHIVAHGMFKAWLFLGTGMTIRAPQVERVRPPVLAALGVSVLVLGAGFAAGIVDPQAPAFLPMAFALTTAILTFLTLPQSGGRTRQIAGTGAMVAMLIAVHMLGLFAAESLYQRSAPAILPASAQLILALLFSLALLWQFKPSAAARQLPRWLYVRLLNAGAIRA
ncbi:proton-conducting transporter membrane subunit [Rhizorhabdus sp.]|uniref:proton-conducting transporter transmembrane domain-containing protein n=1 Tax=Rhizorhabdus sp. TaxID=1968843 RepID=UPI0035B169A3